MAHYIYIMSNPSHSVVYIGVTNNLERRVAEHKAHAVPGFTDTYNAVELVYFEEGPSIEEAIRREKQLKSWSRAKKNRLIESMNPDWRDLAADEKC